MEVLIVAVLASWSWCLFATWLGPRVGYVDIPDGSALKVHERPAVPLGGVGIFLGVHLALLLSGAVDAHLFLATTLVLLLGLIDDRRGLSPLIRLSVEAVAALVLVAGIRSERSIIEMALSVILVLVAINAVNLFDGLDGLVGFVGSISALGVAGFATARHTDPTLPLVLAAALLGFLVLGWHPARVFLGDSGAYVTGMVLAASMMGASAGGVTDLLVAGALLGVFALDLIVTLIRRRRGDRPFFVGDRSHVYDQLVDRGRGVRETVYLMAAIQGVLIVSTIGFDVWFPGWLTIGLIALTWGAVIGLLATAGYLGETA